MKIIVTEVPYSPKFLWEKNFARPSYNVPLHYRIILPELIFANTVMVTISCIQSLTQEKRFMDKISPLRAGGKIGKKSLAM